jgi:hypothetical protein
LPDHSSVTKAIIQVLDEDGNLLIDPVSTFCDFLSPIVSQEYGLELFISGKSVIDLKPIYLLITMINLDLNSDPDDESLDTVNILAFTLFPLFVDSSSGLPFNSDTLPTGVSALLTP